MLKSVPPSCRRDGCAGSADAAVGGGRPGDPRPGARTDTRPASHPCCPLLAVVSWRVFPTRLSHQLRYPPPTPQGTLQSGGRGRRPVLPPALASAPLDSAPSFFTRGPGIPGGPGGEQHVSAAEARIGTFFVTVDGPLPEAAARAWLVRTGRESERRRRRSCFRSRALLRSPLGQREVGGSGPRCRAVSGCLPAAYPPPYPPPTRRVPAPTQESLLWEPEQSVAAQLSGRPPDVLRAKGLLSVSPPSADATGSGQQPPQPQGASGGAAGRAGEAVEVLQAVRQVYELTDWVRPADGGSVGSGGSRMVFVGRELSAEGLRASLERAIAEAAAAGGQGGAGAALPRVRAWQV